jgi:Protein of unknown function (DUF2442)
MEQVIKTQINPNYELELWFNTGDHKLFDCAPYLKKGTFTALQAPNFFRQARVVAGTVCWPNNMDLSPETLFDKSVSVSDAAD